MGKIIELDLHIANQIAAGEVVERPSSAVKELLENAIDAEAKNIEVRIKDGGFTHIVVQDDGCGMDEEDVVLACKRYATSKLKEVDDLENISTFGFRGEALPSIASISRMNIISRTKAFNHATIALIEAGILNEISRKGAPLGTRIEVRDLFFNVPARLKFAKTKRAETAEIHRLILAFIFLYPDIKWKLFIDDKISLNFTSNDQTERACALLGQDMGLLYPIDHATDLMQISGFIGAPMAARRDSRNIIVFVNNRLISDKKLVMAIKTAFRTLLLVGNNPVCALKIEIDSKDVDVNVHPRKAEVRFREERRVLSHLISTIGEFLSKTPWLKKDDPTEERPTYISYSPALSFTPSLKTLVMRDSQSFMPQPIAQKLLASDKFSNLRAIGQLCSTYLLAEGEDGLVVIDQHAAHERVMFEKIKKQKFLKEPLLLPITIKLDLALMLEFEEHVKDFISLGIDIEKFGPDSVVIRSLPPFAKNCDVFSLIADLLSDFSQNLPNSALNLQEHLCATMACHSSIRAGQKMRKEEIEALLIELDEIEFAAHCPHGRPLVKSFSAYELKKWFDRT